jgi:hypothetical protein
MQQINPRRIDKQKQQKKDKEERGHTEEAAAAAARRQGGSIVLPWRRPVPGAGIARLGFVDFLFSDSLGFCVESEKRWKIRFGPLVESNRIN